MSITLNVGWRTGRVVFGIILILAGAVAAVGSFMGIFGSVWGTGLTIIYAGVGVVVAVAGALVIISARKKLKGQAQEIDIRFLPKK